MSTLVLVRRFRDWWFLRRPNPVDDGRKVGQFDGDHGREDRQDDG